jgi:hypothetical protein
MANPRKKEEGLKNIYFLKYGAQKTRSNDRVFDIKKLILSCL